ncbi:MAG: ParB/RepB/Spo0J family partition protein [Ruminococcus sp.]|nr:ParB/RepB/Spo0J family partition protein [Ruminococcus sp.]
MTTAFDLGSMLSGGQPQIREIPCDSLQPYRNHKFTLYKGERLDDMVESIRENGVLSPVIVQPLQNGLYEILIGHNRWNAAKLAGRSTVPAIVKEGLSESEAEMYVIESNLMQRGFENLATSEQAAVIAQRHSEMFSQGKRSDIIRELQILEHTGEKIEATTSCPVGEKLDTG